MGWNQPIYVTGIIVIKTRLFFNNFFFLKSPIAAAQPCIMCLQDLNYFWLTLDSFLSKKFIKFENILKTLV